MLLALISSKQYSPPRVMRYIRVWFIQHKARQINLTRTSQTQLQKINQDALYQPQLGGRESGEYTHCASLTLPLILSDSL